MQAAAAAVAAAAAAAAGLRGGPLHPRAQLRQRHQLRGRAERVRVWLRASPAALPAPEHAASRPHASPPGFDPPRCGRAGAPATAAEPAAGPVPQSAISSVSSGAAGSSPWPFPAELSAWPSAAPAPAPGRGLSVAERLPLSGSGRLDVGPAAA